MLLLVNMPHSGRVEEDYSEALETVSTTLTEGGKADNIELKLGNAGEDLQDLDKGSQLNRGTCTWEPREESTASTCRPC